ncbi:MAG: ribosomal L7Ae/L30e/S12e/Gadd45 family protein [Firmicutes bacterium]|nr:ribosomal L7Ae/L30e/S12e/Gadd45 family protein [Bacillota bacterium]
MSKDITGLLGLAMSAGRVVSGTEATIEAVRSGKARLVILAQDSGLNLRKQVTDKCRSYDVDCVEGPEGDVLGASVGKDRRMCVAITEENLANELKELLMARFGGGNA